MLKSSFKTSDSTNIYYETHGFESSGPAVIFLNGTMQTTFNWRPHARVFKDSFRVILYDARAQGQSDLGEQRLSLDLHLQDLSELLHHLKIKKAHFVGLSHGAYVSLSLAFQLPQVVDRLVLCSVGARITDQTKVIIRSWLEILQQSGLRSLSWAVLPIVFGEAYLKQNKRIIDKMVEAIVVRNNKDALIAQLKAINQYPSPGSLAKKINCPALIISGLRDRLVNTEDAKKLANLCRGRHEDIPGIGHSIPAEAPELFNKIVLEFLTQS
ncbi:MAG: alpha/beta hydrolase [Desulfobacterales bacterium]|nr:alpha/beta hydrolase [Desulfobacterales bacterium]MDX2507961.1 alpha/beta hydrolase [Desulfobacterales bacterium]